MPDWQRFVLQYGWRAKVGFLAAVLGQSVEDVAGVRRRGPLARLKSSKGFAELFSLWHGRSPNENDWPVPALEGGAGYAWHGPEVALLGSLVGRLGPAEIAATLTRRLRKITGDRRATRSKVAVVSRMHIMGLVTSDLLGGISTTQAAKEIGSYAVVYQAIAKGHLRARRVGNRLLIPFEAWKEWKANRTLPPKDSVKLSSLKIPLGIRSDHLSEFARAGCIPGAVQVTSCLREGKSTAFGTWYIGKEAARKLVADRRAGRPMPWYGMPTDANLQQTYGRWLKRRHPKSCKACRGIWGKRGAPRSFQEYTRRYPILARTLKIHLTKPWSPGLTPDQLAKSARKPRAYVLKAIKSGALKALRSDGRLYVTKNAAWRWKAAGCPVRAHIKTWISLETARRQHHFTYKQLREFIRRRELRTMVCKYGPKYGELMVSRAQCARLRKKLGYGEALAARLVGISPAKLRSLSSLFGHPSGRPLSPEMMYKLKASMNRKDGWTLDEAAALVRKPLAWVQARRDEGVIRVRRSRQDGRQPMITIAMLQRLQAAAKGNGLRAVADEDWLTLQEACLEAGVSQTSVLQWIADGELERRRFSTGWRYHRSAVRSRARQYWRLGRPQRRSSPPAWLLADARRAPCGATVNAEGHRRLAA